MEAVRMLTTSGHYGPSLKWNSMEPGKGIGSLRQSTKPVDMNVGVLPIPDSGFAGLTGTDRTNGSTTRHDIKYRTDRPTVR